MRLIAKITYGIVIFLRWILTIVIGAVLGRVIIGLVFEQRLTVDPSFENKLEVVLAGLIALPLIIGIHNLLYRATLPIKRLLKIDWKDGNLRMSDINDK